jgi:hypothetical protein
VIDMEECQRLWCKRFLPRWSRQRMPEANFPLGDGITDDTTAIKRAVSEGGRCGANCGSSTIYPAVVWFPKGTYLVSSSIIQYFNTQFLGDVSRGFKAQLFVTCLHFVAHRSTNHTCRRKFRRPRSHIFRCLCSRPSGMVRH